MLSLDFDNAAEVLLPPDSTGYDPEEFLENFIRSLSQSAELQELVLAFLDDEEAEVLAKFGEVLPENSPEEAKGLSKMIREYYLSGYDIPSIIKFVSHYSARADALVRTVIRNYERKQK